MDATVARAFHYRAFISYSRHDEAVVVRWMRKLERFRLPARLVGRQTERGEVPRFLRPIFRDREEFSPHHSLKGAIEEALRQSEFMLLFCSPASARSRWVNEEVALFKELNGTRKIITIIVDGNPDAPVGEDQAGCLPPALTLTTYGADAVPLGVDVRDGGDGEQIAMLKVIAAMIGVPLGELQQRHQKRNRQIRAALGSAALGISVVMAGLAYQATQARNEAQAQRQEAETLIEFMLGDLREKLVPVGRQDVLASVGARALDYYERQDLSAMPSESIGRRARAFHLLGETLRDSGKYEAAKDYFELAFDSTRQILSRTPDDYQAIYDHAQSAFWLGNIHVYLRDNDQLLAGYEGYYRLTKRLYDLAPDDPEARMEWVWGNNNMGSFYTRYRPDAQKAAAYNAAGYKLLLALNEEYPGNRKYLRSLAINRMWQADAALHDYNWQRALTLRTESDRWLLAWKSQETDWDFEQQIAINYLNIAVLNLRLGNYAAAQQAADEAATRYLALAQHDASVPGHIRNLSYVFTVRAFLDFLKHDSQPALVTALNATMDKFTVVSKKLENTDQIIFNEIVDYYYESTPPKTCAIDRPNQRNLSRVISYSENLQAVPVEIHNEIYWFHNLVIGAKLAELRANQSGCKVPQWVQDIFDKISTLNGIQYFEYSLRKEFSNQNDR